VELLLRSLKGNHQRDHVLARITAFKAGCAVCIMALRHNVDMSGRSVVMVGVIVTAVRVNVQRRPSGGQYGHGDAKTERDPPTHEGSLRRDAD
jgi:hypothetical protein